MDNIQCTTKKVTHDIGDTNLPAVMASLEMLTVNTSSSPENRKILTGRRIINSCNENLNRRCSLRPRKRTCSKVECDNIKEQTQKNKEIDVKEYYLNKSLKRKLNNLETIYEEKEDISDSTRYMSIKRYKRMIQFQDKPSDSKIKKRRAKAKKVFGSKINFKRRCASMQILLDKLNNIRAESPTKVDSEMK